MDSSPAQRTARVRLTVGRDFSISAFQFFSISPSIGSRASTHRRVIHAQNTQRNIEATVSEKKWTFRYMRDHATPTAQMTRTQPQRRFTSSIANAKPAAVAVWPEGKELYFALPKCHEPL